jgi:CheY-like chemotaxis protein
MNKLMVVDSDRAVQKWIESNLRGEGFEVSSFDDGLTALDMLSRLDPDLVLAAYNLEGINIFRFCDKLRQRSVSKARPLLLLVNTGEMIDQNRLRAAGVVDFVNKPLEPKDLIEKIKGYSVEPATVIQRMPSAPPAEPKPSSALGGEEQREVMKIEELLGWSLPGEKTLVSPHPPRPQEDDQTIIETRIPVKPAAPEPSVPSSLDREAVKVESPPESMATPTAESAIPPPQEPPAVFAPESQAVTGTMAEQAQAIFTPETEAPEPPEEPAATAAPVTAAAGPSSISPEALEAAVEKMAREMIEKIAWEVVPSLAETLIKEEIERLKSNPSK